ncbi:YbaY family lipoprotein [Planctomicrobium sp. SH527]|uniref:YbaY family lipoprotein n=1 Tax=Planctomicrobium sp. SH527 TaxID=3448123 RepID=UPI003F5B9F0C
MKRISLAAAALAGCLAASVPDSASAVDPSRQNGGNQVQPYGTTLPGLGGLGNLGGYYNNGLGGNLSNDPLYNPGLLTTPNYPGLINPTLPGTGVTFTPTTPATGRDRLNPNIAPTYVPPGTQQARKWLLGVYSKDLDTGVRIHEVVTGRAAHRAGLEVNDQIISVNGYQVGYVNGQLFDCGTEFDRLADQNGWVNLLVQNARDRSLVNVPVQLDSRFSSLTGTLSTNNRQALPQNAIVTVELRQILSNNNNHSATIASRRVENLNQYPIPFTVDFDPNQISPTSRYIVYANATVNGREIYRTAQQTPILATNGQFRPVAMQLEQVAFNNPNTAQVGYLDRDSQIAQIVKWFNDYLGRNPTDRELITWLEAISQGQSMSQVQLSLLSNEQFFNSCNADKRVYISRMHELLIGRAPTNEEMAYWISRYDAQNGIRRDLAREFQGAVGIN